MKLKDMIRRFRVIADDLAEPHLWAEADLIAWANMAEREACRRSPLLVDSRTVPMTEIAVAANEPFVRLDPRIVTVRRARVQNEPRPVPLLTVAEMDEQRPGWEDETSEQLEAMVTDAHAGMLRAYPTQTAETVVYVTVQRLPLADMSDLEHRPETRIETHEYLVDWMLAEAYSVDDVEKADPTKAEKHRNAFDAQFGVTAARHETFQRGVGQHDWQAGIFR